MPEYEYRYRLGRRWLTGDQNRVLWIMLNPSTADETTDDPTIRRCIRFATDWGYDELEVVNLFAARATDPKDLAADPLAAIGGHHADVVIDSALRAAAMVVCAWGVIPRPLRHLNRDRQVLDLVRARLRVPHNLGLTKEGFPRHPLYLRADTRPRVWLEEMAQ